MSIETVKHNDWLTEWCEQLGINLMMSVKCTHYGDQFGAGAVCVTCFDNTQHIGEVCRRAAAIAWDRGRAAARHDWEASGSGGRLHHSVNPYRPAQPANQDPESGERGGA